MVKEALKYFFDLALEFNLKYNRNNLEYDMFLTCIDETLVSSEMYIHKKNDYVYWLPIEKKEIYDFSPIEKEFNIIIHHDIKEYYNSYYFLELLTGTEQYGDIYMDIVCEYIRLSELNNNVRSMVKEEGIEGISMGMSYAGPILVDNKTGKVFLQNHSRVEYGDSILYEKLADSLAEFLKW